MIGALIRNNVEWIILCRIELCLRIRLENQFQLRGVLVILERYIYPSCG